MTTEITIRGMDDLSRVANAISQSGMFGVHNNRNVAQAITKILAGQEYGFGPWASMKAFHIIDGNPELSAHALAGLVRRHEDYDYQVKVLTDEQCTIEFLNGEGDVLGESIFTMEDAQQANVKFESRTGQPMPWRMFPRNMLFARAMSNGVRWYCPDVTLGAATYVEGEINVDADAEYITIDSEMEEGEKEEEKKGMDDEVNFREVETAEQEK